MTEEEYWRALRGALRQLYDHTALRRNPLNALLVANAPGQNMQDLLLDAVNALSPARNTSLQSDARRTYQILLHRYVEQFSQGEVADTLGLSARQLRRQEQLAIRTLGEHLRTRYALIIQPTPAQSGAGESAEDSDTTDSVDSEAIDATRDEYEEELEWVHQSTPQEAIDVVGLVDGALQTLAPLLRELEMMVATEHAPDLPQVAGNPMALRQALVVAISSTARNSKDGHLAVETSANGQSAQIVVRSNALVSEQAEDIGLARRLVALSGGELLQRDDGVALSLPVVQPVTVLVIDDNQDVLLLVLRYLTGTRYRAVTARDPIEGIALAESLQPSAILLNVMLPGMDGWEVLKRLRANPATQNLPIFISTILPEEQLATALGATAFLRKPLARDELLRALNNVTS